MRMAAFCGPTCWKKYYRKHCRVCDAATERATDPRIVSLCSKKCKTTYRKNGQHLRAFSRDLAPHPVSRAKPVQDRSKKMREIRVFEPPFAGCILTVWGAAGKRTGRLVPHPKWERVYCLEPGDKPLMFTELEIKRLMTPAPKPKSVPLSLMGSTHQFPGGI